MVYGEHIMAQDLRFPNSQRTGIGSAQRPSTRTAYHLASRAATPRCRTIIKQSNDGHLQS